jgi:cytoskeletal protein CcmA (bactofilin family)
MFNKPSVFGRNDPVTRRDAVPVLASGASSAAAERNAAATKAASLNPPPPATPPATLPAATPSATSLADNVSGARLIVGPDVKLKGAEILDCDTLVVEGRVEATMDSRAIRIAEKGSFIGKVSIDIAEIHGHFEGELTARSQLIIHSTGRVSGTIRFGKLVVAEGGELNGEISVISEPGAVQARPAVAPLVAPAAGPFIEPFVARSAAAG